MAQANHERVQTHLQYNEVVKVGSGVVVMAGKEVVMVGKEVEAVKVGHLPHKPTQHVQVSTMT